VKHVRRLLPWAASLAVSVLVAMVTPAWLYACAGIWTAVALQLASQTYLPVYTLCWLGLLWPGSVLTFLGGVCLGLWQLHKQNTNGD